MVSPARIIRFSDYPVVPWKNGLGVTRELVSVGARSDGSFAWRLSMADIAVDAPFSHFAGIERQLAVVAGGPLELLVSGRSRRIEIGGAITTFAGDIPVSARPLDGTVTDLNLMIDPSDWSGSLEMVSGLTHARIAASGRASASTAVVAIRDGLSVRTTDAAGAEHRFELDALDCLLADGVTSLAIEGAAERAAAQTVAVLVRVEPRAR